MQANWTETMKEKAAAKQTETGNRYTCPMRIAQHNMKRRDEGNKNKHGHTLLWSIGAVTFHIRIVLEHTSKSKESSEEEGEKYCACKHVPDFTHSIHSAYCAEHSLSFLPATLLFFYTLFIPSVSALVLVLIFSLSLIFALSTFGRHILSIWFDIFAFGFVVPQSVDIFGTVIDCQSRWTSREIDNANKKRQTVLKLLCVTHHNTLCGNTMQAKLNKSSIHARHSHFIHVWDDEIVSFVNSMPCALRQQQHIKRSNHNIRYSFCASRHIWIFNVYRAVCRWLSHCCYYHFVKLWCTPFQNPIFYNQIFSAKTHAPTTMTISSWQKEKKTQRKLYWTTM